jgi:U4/U6.U5 tri-snRNP-associated protein 2
MEGTQQMQQR